MNKDTEVELTVNGDPDSSPPNNDNPQQRESSRSARLRKRKERKQQQTQKSSKSVHFRKTDELPDRITPGNIKTISWNALKEAARTRYDLSIRRKTREVLEQEILDEEGYVSGNAHEEEPDALDGLSSSDANQNTSSNGILAFDADPAREEEKNEEDATGLDHPRLQQEQLAKQQAKDSNISNPTPALDGNNNTRSPATVAPVSVAQATIAPATTTQTAITALDQQLIAQITAQVIAQLSGQWQAQLNQQQQSYEAKQQSYEAKLQSLQAALEQKTKQKQQTIEKQQRKDAARAAFLKKQKEFEKIQQQQAAELQALQKQFADSDSDKNETLGYTLDPRANVFEPRARAPTTSITPAQVLAPSTSLRTQSTGTAISLLSLSRRMDTATIESLKFTATLSGKKSFDGWYESADEVYHMKHVEAHIRFSIIYRSIVGKAKPFARNIKASDEQDFDKEFVNFSDEEVLVTLSKIMKKMVSKYSNATNEIAIVLADLESMIWRSENGKEKESMRDFYDRWESIETNLNHWAKMAGHDNVPLDRQDLRSDDDLKLQLWDAMDKDLREQIKQDTNSREPQSYGEVKIIIRAYIEHEQIEARRQLQVLSKLGFGSHGKHKSKFVHCHHRSPTASSSNEDSSNNDSDSEDNSTNDSDSEEYSASASSSSHHGHGRDRLSKDTDDNYSVDGQEEDESTTTTTSAPIPSMQVNAIVQPYHLS